MVYHFPVETTTQSERWDFLRPWCAPLREQLGLRLCDLDRVPTRRYAGVDVSLPEREGDATPAKLRAVRDALVLLALVARVDHNAWKYVLNALCGLNLDAYPGYQETDGFRQARFATILVVTGDNEDWIARMLKAFFSGFDAPPSAPLYRSCKESSRQLRSSSR